MAKFMLTRRMPTLPLQCRRFKHTNVIPKCPEPTYDTGCTFCRPSPEIEATLKSPPESIRHTIPPLSKLIVYRSNNKNNETWPKKVEAYEIMRNISKVGRGNGNMICLSSLSPRHPEALETEAHFFIFPDAKNVFFDLQSQPQETAFRSLFETLNSGKPLETTPTMKVAPVEKPIVLVCGHAKRDIRCGVVGKLVHDEFVKVLGHEKLSDKVELGYISHVGGHVYAGNVIILKPDGSVTWYGMVMPQHVQGIVEKSVKNDEVIEELSRD